MEEANQANLRQLSHRWLLYALFIHQSIGGENTAFLFSFLPRCIIDLNMARESAIMDRLFHTQSVWTPLSYYSCVLYEGNAYTKER